MGGSGSASSGGRATTPLQQPSVSDLNGSAAAASAIMGDDQQHQAAAAVTQHHQQATVANSRSISSTASVSSSEGSNGSHHHLADAAELQGLIRDVKIFSEALRRLKRVFAQEAEEPWETQRVACHERLSEMLRILRNMLERYPPLQNNDLVNSAGFLINQVKEYREQDDLVDEREFHQALNWLAIAFSNGVSEYFSGWDSSNDSATSSSSSKQQQSHHHGTGGSSSVHHQMFSASHAELEGMAMAMREEATQALREDAAAAAMMSVIAPDGAGGGGGSGVDVDEFLMRHPQGVDHALKYAKFWEKYAKDVMNYVEKRTSLEQEWSRNLAKLAQTTRQVLRAENYLPFQSVYCMALDQDVELCKNVQTACAHLQSYKFMEPLYARRAEHHKARKILKDKWTKELKTLQETVSNLKKAKATYMERNREYERCREAVKIAEQGAEIGATGENKVFLELSHFKNQWL